MAETKKQKNNSKLFDVPGVWVRIKISPEANLQADKAVASHLLKTNMSVTKDVFLSDMVNDFLLKLEF